MNLYTNDHGKQTCSECHRYDCLDAQISHARRCPGAHLQPGSADADAAAITSHANRVRRTATTGGNDDATYQAVRRGYLSIDDAMNTDD